MRKVQLDATEEKARMDLAATDAAAAQLAAYEVEMDELEKMLAGVEEKAAAASAAHAVWRLMSWSRSWHCQ